MEGLSEEQKAFLFDKIAARYHEGDDAIQDEWDFNAYCAQWLKEQNLEGGPIDDGSTD